MRLNLAIYIFFVLIILNACNGDNGRYIKIEDNNSDIPPIDKSLKNIEIPIISTDELNNE